MKRANAFKQNSREWYKWRGTGLGASDAPVVMGVSPYKTRFELWGEKVGLLTPPDPNPFAVAAMKRGHELEPEARKRYEALAGRSFEAVNCEHPDFSFIRASLDGFNEELNKFIEIKCPGKADHQLARRGLVPEKYVVQMQAQYAVSGAAAADYVSYDGKDDLVVIAVKPDLELQAKIVQALREFWALVESKTPPKVDALDLVRVVDSIQGQTKKLMAQIEGLKALADAMAGQLFLGGKNE